MELSLYQVDAFSSRRFQGNPAAVCPLEQWLPDEQMQAIAMENNLSETAFFVPKGTDFELRWFTPVAEVRLCGHATLATAHVLFEHMAFPLERVIFFTKSGPLTVHKALPFYLMDFPADTPEPITTPEEVINGLSITPAASFRGRDDLLVVLESQDQIEQLRPDFRELGRLECRGVIATAPGREADFVSRCFYPNYGVDEDPVTGSAHTTMTPYWAERLGRNELTARQLSKRGGFVQCRLENDRVILGGQAVTYLIGTIWS